MEYLTSFLVAANSATAPGVLESGGVIYVGIRHSAGYCDIPRKSLAAAPWNKSATIWPFTISANQTRWFFTGRDSCSPQSSEDAVIKCMMSGSTARRVSAYHTMDP